jgi:hypothetical protein
MATRPENQPSPGHFQKRLFSYRLRGVLRLSESVSSGTRCDVGEVIEQWNNRVDVGGPPLETIKEFRQVIA